MILENNTCRYLTHTTLYCIMYTIRSESVRIYHISSSLNFFFFFKPQKFNNEHTLKQDQVDQVLQTHNYYVISYLDIKAKNLVLQIFIFFHSYKTYDTASGAFISSSLLDELT